RRAGRACGDFMMGTDFLFPAVLKLRSGAEELLKDNGSPFELRPSQHVFLMHQGYQFSYFDCADGRDPAVFHYLEPETSPRPTGETLSAWIVGAARDCVSARMRLEELRRRRTMRCS